LAQQECQRPEDISLGHEDYNASEEFEVPEKEIIFAVVESPEGGYGARALGHSIFTQAETMEELKGMVRDAVSCHFEARREPCTVRVRFS